MNRCNNCGNVFHTYKQCRIPITSNGVIHVNNGKYLMIRRRKTLGYVDFMRGRYSPKKHAYIMNLVDEMTVQEKKDLLELDFTTLSHQMWGAAHEETYARDKFNQIKGDGMLAALIEASPTRWATQEWGFPKGRRNMNETELNCALREYEEETGYDRHGLNLVRNVVPYDEIFTGSNYKAYKHKYYLAFGEPRRLRSFQDSEVSDMRWVSYEEAVSLIRPYNTERILILTHVHKLVSDHFGQ